MAYERVKKENSVLFMRNVPTRLKEMFKSKAAARSDSMTAIIVALMELYVNEPDCVLVRKVKKKYRWNPKQE